MTFCHLQWFFTVRSISRVVAHCGLAQRAGLCLDASRSGVDYFIIYREANQNTRGQIFETESAYNYIQVFRGGRLPFFAP